MRKTCGVGPRSMACSWLKLGSASAVGQARVSVVASKVDSGQCEKVREREGGARSKLRPNREGGERAEEYARCWRGGGTRLVEPDWWNRTAGGTRLVVEPDWWNQTTGGTGLLPWENPISEPRDSISGARAFDVRPMFINVFWRFRRYKLDFPDS